MKPAAGGGKRPGSDAVEGGLVSIDALIDEASMESFPASDAPSYWGRTVTEVQTRVQSAPKHGDEDEARGAQPT